MDEPQTVPAPQPDPAITPAGDVWGRAGTRLALFFLHVAILVALFVSTPSNYYFQLGASVGLLVIFGCLFLWGLLYAAKTRDAVLLFCTVALVQVGFVTFVVWQYRAEDRAFQQVMAGLPQKQKEWQSRLAQFPMDPLFEMSEGKRELSTEELWELDRRAKAAQIELPAVAAEEAQWYAQAESRVAKVSPQGARTFHRGRETRQPESDEMMKLLQGYYAETGQVTQFLIERQHRYRVTADGIVFDRDQDAQAFNEKMEAIAHLQEQIGTLAQKSLEKSRELSGGH